MIIKMPEIKTQINRQTKQEKGARDKLW